MFPEVQDGPAIGIIVSIAGAHTTNTRCTEDAPTVTISLSDTNYPELERAKSSLP